MITREQYLDITSREKAWQQFIGDVTRTTPEEIQRFNAPTNKERSQAEIYAWHADKPKQAFVYPDEGLNWVTNWMSETLGRVTWKGEVWWDSFGGKRQAVRVKGTNGVNYYGTVYRTYCRLKACK